MLCWQACPPAHSRAGFRLLPLQALQVFDHRPTLIRIERPADDAVAERTVTEDMAGVPVPVQAGVELEGARDALRAVANFPG